MLLLLSRSETVNIASIIIVTCNKRQERVSNYFRSICLWVNLWQRQVLSLERKFDNSERLENLSYAIGYYRKKKGYSQEQMAEMLGISRQHLAAEEAPGMDRGISLELLFNIAAVLEIEPYLLLKFRLEK